MKYRTLEPDDIIQEGDRCSTDWNTFSEGIIASQHNLGAKVGTLNPDFWRRPAKHNWISFKDRKPTKEDASLIGNVLTREPQGGLYFELWGRPRSDDDGGYWMALNFASDAPTPIKVDGKEILPQKDGSVKLSCGTVIPKESVEEFIRQRTEIMK